MRGKTAPSPMKKLSPRASDWPVSQLTKLCGSCYFVWNVYLSNLSVTVHDSCGTPQTETSALNYIEPCRSVTAPYCLNQFLIMINHRNNPINWLYGNVWFLSDALGEIWELPPSSRRTYSWPDQAPSWGRDARLSSSGTWLLKVWPMGHLLRIAYGVIKMQIPGPHLVSQSPRW